ncbi:MAG: hypothetical protein V7607_5634 [Solirubrobacteraceae bacterium]
MAGDVVETVGALRPGEDVVDLLLGHLLGALVSLRCVVEHPTFARRLVLEDPPGSDSVDFARLGAEARLSPAAARADPEDAARTRFGGASAHLPTAIRQAIVDAVAAADPVYVPAVLEHLVDTDLIVLSERCEAPTLALLARDKPGGLGRDTGSTLREEMADHSALVGEERQRFMAALQRGHVCEIDSGHSLHHLAFDRYVVLLSRWLAETDGQ